MADSTVQLIKNKSDIVEDLLVEVQVYRKLADKSMGLGLWSNDYHSGECEIVLGHRGDGKPVD